ncbi:MAG: polyketide synthase dehydratase domain-containing protein, partial [Nocardiopsaceae bacterium]|nr:polyketide synthase dehydratase domain-containing protein [Nocardiopsaceae bacterium]
TVPPFGLVGAELNALLTETAAAAQSVAAALSAPVPAPSAPSSSASAPPPVPAPPALASAAAPAEIAAEREFSLRTMPDMADHCILPQPPGWPDDTDRFPVVPATTLLEIMADAALAAAPGRVVIGFEQVKAMRWLAVAPPTFATVRATAAGAGRADAVRADALRAGTGRADTGRAGAERIGPTRVRVSIEGYASGDVLLADRYPAAPDPDPTPLREPRPAPVSARELYSDGWMFHGPRFAGVDDIAVLGDDGIAGTVLALAARGALLDSAGQLIGHWMQVSRTTDQVVLPTGIRAVRLYGPQPPTGQPLSCTAWIREVTATEMRADAELRGPEGRVWCRIEGWSTRRFATDAASWHMKNHPGTAGLSVPGPGGWSVVHEGWPDTASRELMMRRYLNAAERADYDRRNPLQQRRWLLGRIAAKDAVRRFLWDRGAGPLYPCELTVTETDGDFRVRGPLRAPPVTVILSPPDHRGRPYAAAATGDVEPLELEGFI